jgi:hypothetical protein
MPSPAMEMVLGIGSESSVLTEGQNERELAEI